MNKLVAVAVAALIAVTGLAGIGSTDNAAAADVTVHTPEIDTTSYIKNPGMGWQLYIEEFDVPIVDAGVFWAQVDEYGWSATDLYLRVPWSRMEPTEGNYAWDNDANYKAIVQGAEDRGIKLAFRIVPDSQDVWMQATPQFVFDAGATGYATASNASFKTPFVTDKIFQGKFNNFIAAFGEQYNDPAVVDYIDANGLGWWGEMSSIRNGQTRPVLEWITGEYANAFPDVMLAMNYPSGFAKSDQDAMIEKYDLAIRRDGLGSTQWMDEGQKQEIASKFLEGAAIIGENCYQNMTTRPTACDNSFKKPTMGGMLQRVIDDAKKVRANTMDLRWPATDVPLWLDKYRPMWNDFAQNGGYRLAPKSVSVPTDAMVDLNFPIQQTWVNGGVGRLPNSTGGWHDKYRVSYALLDSDGAVVDQVTDMTLNPGDWVKGREYNRKFWATFSKATPGTYELAVGIVDTSTDNKPAISLAICESGDATCNSFNPVVGTEDEEGGVGGTSGAGYGEGGKDASFVNGINVIDAPQWHGLGAITLAARPTVTVTETVTAGTTATATASTTATATSSTTATATITTTATTTTTATATASTSATATSSNTATATVTATSASTAPTTPGPVDVYSTPGFHNVNGRSWYTRCEPYSQTTRCYTEIWGTQVSKVGGTYVQKTGWVFNNLTYLASPRALWVGNPLGRNGAWTDANGTKWRTECDTALTGGNGCRSFMWAELIEAKKTSAGTSWSTKWDWRFNNMVRFS